MHIIINSKFFNYFFCKNRIIKYFFSIFFKKIVKVVNHLAKNLRKKNMKNKAILSAVILLVSMGQASASVVNDLAGATGTLTFNVEIVPEPCTIVLMSCGLVVLAIRRRTRAGHA